MPVFCLSLATSRTTRVLKPKSVNTANIAANDMAKVYNPKSSLLKYLASIITSIKARILVRIEEVFRKKVFFNILPALLI